MKFFNKLWSYVLFYGFIRTFVYFVKLCLFYICRIIGTRKHLVKKIHGRYKMYLDSRDNGISKTLYVYGTREQDQVFIVENSIKRGMGVLDIGANIGYYVLLEAELVGSCGRVYAFEPHPANFGLLKENIELNGFSKRVELYNMGVSDRNGRTGFFISKKSNLHTLNPQYYRKDSRQIAFINSITIDLVDIAKFLADKRDIDFIRMDIEGHEVNVLNGISNIVMSLNKSPFILLETHFPKYDDVHHNMREALLRLFGVGYKICAIVSNNELQSPLRLLGYKTNTIIKTDGVYRGIYTNVDNIDAVNCVCDIGGIRAIFLRTE